MKSLKLIKLEKNPEGAAIACLSRSAKAINQVSHIAFMKKSFRQQKY